VALSPVELDFIETHILHNFESVRVLHQSAPHMLRICKGSVGGELHAEALSSLSAPRITIFSASSGNGRCNAFASSHGARIQTSRSSSVVRIDPGKKVLFQFFHLCRHIGISANSVGGILARQNPDIVIRL